MNLFSMLTAPAHPPNCLWSFVFLFIIFKNCLYITYDCSLPAGSHEYHPSLFESFCLVYGIFFLPCKGSCLFIVKVILRVRRTSSYFLPALIGSLFFVFPTGLGFTITQIMRSISNGTFPYGHPLIQHNSRRSIFLLLFEMLPRGILIFHM